MVYPRASGGTVITDLIDQLEHGLSPRERGNHRLRHHRGDDVGSIPARAGEPGANGIPGSRRTVYPRASGGTRDHINENIPYWGLSPRERGNPQSPGSRASCDGSIPARAGEPRRLSPRERGNPVVPTAWGAQERSIPARAGEPPMTSDPTPSVTVYPRASGGTSPSGRVPPLLQGLSPRERGNRDPPDCRRGGLRSIPARAGEPSPATCATAPRAVYPRASGGTLAVDGLVEATLGLSPRERGNLSGRGPGEVFQRSIPARAGEPRLTFRLRVTIEVYPRASGGTGRAPAEWWP